MICRTSYSPLISRYLAKANSRAAEKPWPTKKRSRVFDSTRQSVKNTGSEDLLLLHVDFWHPAVTEDEKQMLAYFWMPVFSAQIRKIKHPRPRLIPTRRIDSVSPPDDRGSTRNRRHREAWQFDQYHPSTRAKYTRRVNFRKGPGAPRAARRRRLDRALGQELSLST